MRRFALAALLLAAGPTPPAAALEPLRGSFAAEAACEAYVAFRQRRNPDAARLTIGERYELRGRNQAGGDWLQVEVPGAVPAARWVEATCGTAVLLEERRAGLRLLFDHVDEGGDDPAPPPPPLAALDRAVLATCSPWSSRPRRAAFRAMLDRPELTPVLAALAGNGGHERLKDELARAWFAADGFRHVFCGEPRADDLAGLHYRGRLLELQEAGLAGLVDPRTCRAEIDPPVYTVGIRYLPPGGGLPRSTCPKSYDAELDAGAILIAGTRAWRAARGDGMCMAALGGGRWAVAVSRDGGLRTFYPDASPRCDDGGRPASCACDG